MHIYKVQRRAQPRPPCKTVMCDEGEQKGKTQHRNNENKWLVLFRLLLRFRCIRYLDSYFGYCRLFDSYFDVCCCVCPAFDVIHIRVNHFLILLPMWMSLVAESELCVCLSKKCYSFCWKLPFAVARSVSVIFPIIFRNR